MHVIFWFSVLFILYAYFGYPLMLALMAMVRERPVKRDAGYSPSVTLIITVHNEEARIREKIANTKRIDYPSELFEVLIASDASTDRTESIVGEESDFGIVRSTERRGKEYAQKLAVDRAKGEILVFSDVATILDPDGIRNIAANFADPTVGCVSSEDRFVDEQGRVSGEGAYVRYEMFLRRLESRVHSLVGLSGSFFAARREVCADWAVDLQSDFNTLLNSLKRGLRGVSDSQAVGYYRNIADEKKEFNRKVRTVVRGLSVLRRNLSVLNVRKYGLFSWQLFSHKLCRWLVPFFLLLAFVSNFFLLTSSVFYSLLFAAQIVFYIVAFLYYSGIPAGMESADPVSPWRGAFQKLRKIPYYFVVVNAAIFMAWLKFLKGERSVFWEPSKR
jgi:glycosyltransferase involved in cell wall biosynthesis